MKAAWVITLVVLATSLTAFAATPWVAPTLADVQQALVGLEFDEFIDTAFRLSYLRTPEEVSATWLASEFGVRNDGMNNYSLEYMDENRQIWACIMVGLDAYDRELLNNQQLVTLDMAEYYWGSASRWNRELVSYPMTYLPSFSFDGHLEMLLTQMHPFNSTADVEDCISRLRQVDEQIDQIIALLEDYRDRGIVAPYPVLQSVQYRVYSMMAASATRHPLFVAIQTKASEIETIAEEQLDVYLAETEEIINTETKPAYRRLYFAVIDILQDAPHERSISQYPTGAATYLTLIEKYADSSWTPDRLYELAKQELAYCRREIDQTAEALGIEDRSSLATIFEAAREATGEVIGEEAAAEARILLEEARTRIETAGVFSSLPSAQVEIQAAASGGFYTKAALDGSMPAVFYIGDSYPMDRYRLASLVYHETIPGHHIECTAAQSPSASAFWRTLNLRAHSEGWAKYAERLMDELGAYDENPYGRLGWLEYRLLDAILVLTDVGLHYRGWTQDQTRRFIIDNTGFESIEADGWVRYITAAPASRTPYIIGESEIVALREQAEEALGSAFDLTEFHAAILENGDVLLPSLRQQVEEWISETGEPSSGT